jgi:intracellular multiplication protein IcmB
VSFDSIFHATNSLIQNLRDWFGLSPDSYTQLYTCDAGKGTLVADDSSMVSLLELRGALKCIGKAEAEEIANKLEATLKTPLTHSCHAIQFVMQYSPDTASASIQDQFAPLKRSAQSLSLDLGDVLDDWADTITSYCADEKQMIAFWTRPTVMIPAELKKARQDNRKIPKPRVNSKIQGIGAIIHRMRSTHEALVNSLSESFGSLGFKCDLLDKHTAVREIRRMIAPNRTARDWRPCLPGDPPPVRKADAGAPTDDMSHVFPPTIAAQVWPCDAINHENRYLEIDDFIYAPIILELPPQTPKPFNNLFQSLKMEIPWRASILITGDGMKGQALKYTLSRILSFANSGNQMYNNAYAALKDDQVNHQGCGVTFQAVFVTWVNKRETNNPLRALSHRAAKLHAAIQSWGSCETKDLSGDPLLAFTATLPACMPNSPATKSLAPLHDVVRMLPVERTCSPWRHAELPLRTPDGRFMPVGLFHSNMASWNEIVFAGMGMGKSFFLNTLNFFFVIRPGQTNLPWLTIIDIGISCSGLINLIQASLPREKRHLAIFARLRNTKEASINVFDTPLGCDAPLPSHLDFLINLLALLCTPLNKTAPADGVTGLLRDAVETTYRRMGRNGESPKKFDRHLDAGIMETLDAEGFAFDSATTWWEVTDFLFSAGNIKQAVSAQRYAVPVIADVAIVCNDQIVKSSYDGIAAGGGKETVPAFCVRSLHSAMKEYPILANPTRFGFGASRIVGIDLQEVTLRGGSPQAVRQSGIMYMVARFVGAAHFFYTKEDVELMPEGYRAYHRPIFESLASDPKRLCFDEFHRSSCADPSNPLSLQILADITTASREARKQNLSIGLYSQLLQDFPDAIVTMATSIYALGAGNYQEAAAIGDRFGFNNAARIALGKISRPTAAGANFVALYKTSDGESILYLTNCAGSYAKWAFSTTAEDMRVRNKLYSRLGCSKALQVLVKAYPQGTIKEELEQRKTHIETTVGENAVDLEEDLFQELMQMAKPA